jgi:hypothetical protein
MLVRRYPDFDYSYEKPSAWFEVLAAIVLGVLSYCLCATVFFGDPLRPIAFALFWHDGLSATYWAGPLLAGLLFGILLTRKRSARLRPAILIVISMTICVLATAIIAETARAQKIARFKPDYILTNRFMNSLRQAPREWQFYLHALAIKDCQHYAWSYREMDFYRLPPSVLKNLSLPKDIGLTIGDKWKCPARWESPR